MNSFNERSPYGLSVFRQLNEINEDWHGMSAKVRGEFGVETRIDEMALRFDNHEDLFAWLTFAVRQDGYELFNSAEDWVTTKPLASSYGVNYWFLLTPYEYRLELMHLGVGHSPLHHLLRPNTPGSLGRVHASFKVKDEEEYANVVRTLKFTGWQDLQYCDSRYGKFSYWEEESSPGPWFLKPRVNLRDAETNDE